jgi:hypothetical protein
MIRFDVRTIKTSIYGVCLTKRSEEYHSEYGGAGFDLLPSNIDLVGAEIEIQNLPP